MWHISFKSLVKYGTIIIESVPKITPLLYRTEYNVNVTKNTLIWELIGYNRDNIRKVYSICAFCVWLVVKATFTINMDK